MGHCVFVGGPIQYAIDDSGQFSKDLRGTLSSLLSALDARGCRVLSAHREERFGDVDMSGKCFEVCARDYAWMRHCDLFVAVLPVDRDGIPVTTSGTCVELGWASAMGKPIVLIVKPNAPYSHLVAGLHAATDVVRLDIDAPLLADELCRTLDVLLATESVINQASAI